MSDDGGSGGGKGRTVGGRYRLVERIGSGGTGTVCVDMPKGTPDEKKGTAVFRPARDRPKIGQG